MNKTLVIASIALVLALTGMFFPKVTDRVVETVSLGASGSGQNTGSFQTFSGGMANGGDIVATSTLSNSTLTARDLMRASCIDMNITQSSGTLTLPATSTLASWLPAGGHREICVRNATTTSSITLTVAVGTGMTLKNSASSTNIITGDTDGDNTLWIRLFRKSDKDYNVYMSRFQD